MRTCEDCVQPNDRVIDRRQRSAPLLPLGETTRLFDSSRQQPKTHQRNRAHDRGVSPPMARPSRRAALRGNV